MANSLYTFLDKEKKYVCNECGLKFCHRVSSVRRHCKRMHNINYKSAIVQYPSNDTSSEEEYVERKLPKFNQNTLQTNINKNQFLKCCVGLVAVKNIPFRIFDDEDFFKVLIEPYEKQFGTKINSRNIGIVVENACSKIRTIMRERLQEKLVSIKVDIATRMDKSIIGINVQYIRNFMVCVNTLGMIQVKKGYTATYLKEEIIHCLNTFGINISQIYSNTLDNGVNVLKAKTILQELLEEGITEASFDMTPADFDRNECLHKKIASAMTVVRCAAHSIHLAAHDVLKTLDLKIKDCMFAVGKMRTGESCQRMPTLENDTRWNSIFDMLCSLQGMKLFLHDQDSDDEFNHIDWDFITNFVAAFEPLALFTRNLQFERYIVGDFYRDWWMCEIELEDLISKTPYAEPLHNAMQSRRKELLKNDAFLAALYLDPRFNFENSVLLTHDQKLSALKHLVKTYNRLIKMETGKSKDLSEEQQSNTFTIKGTTYTAEPMEDEPCTSRQMYGKLAQRIAEKCINTPTAIDEDTHQTLMEKLMLLCQGKKYALDTDVLDYWRVKPYSKDIKKLVEVVLSVPVTQVSAERTFSALSLVLTKLHTKMNDKTINDVLLTKLNFDLLGPNDVIIWD